MAVDIINSQQQKEEEKKKQQQGKAPLSGAPQVGAQQASPMAGGAAGPSQSGRFTNIQRILGANVGNKLGQTVQSGISGMGQGISQNVQQAREQTLGKVQQASSPFSNRAGVIQDVNAAVQAAQTGALRDVGGQKMAGDEALERRVGELREAQYGGPQALSGDDQLKLMGSIGAYRQMLQAGAKSPQNLLQRFVGGQGYTSGQQSLDRLLMGKGPSLASMQRQGLEAQKAYEGAERDVGQAAKEAQDAAAFARYYVTGEGKPFAGGSADIKSKSLAQQARAQGVLSEEERLQPIREEIYNKFRQSAVNQSPEEAKAAIAQGIQQGIFSPDETNELMTQFYEISDPSGRARRARTALEGINEGNYYRSGLYAEHGPLMNRQEEQLKAMEIAAARNATLPQAMTNEELARQNALKRLLGQGATQLDTTLGGQFEAGKLAFADPFKQSVAQKYLESEAALSAVAGPGGAYNPDQFRERTETLGGPTGYKFATQAIGMGMPGFVQGQMATTPTVTRTPVPDGQGGFTYNEQVSYTPNYQTDGYSPWRTLTPQEQQYEDTVREYNNLITKYAPMAGVSGANVFGAAPADMNAYIQQKMAASPDAARWQQLRSTLQGMGA